MYYFIKVVFFIVHPLLLAAQGCFMPPWGGVGCSELLRVVLGRSWLFCAALSRSGLRWEALGCSAGCFGSGLEKMRSQQKSISEYRS